MSGKRRGETVVKVRDRRQATVHRLGWQRIAVIRTGVKARCDGSGPVHPKERGVGASRRCSLTAITVMEHPCRRKSPTPVRQRAAARPLLDGLRVLEAPFLHAGV